VISQDSVRVLFGSRKSGFVESDRDGWETRVSTGLGVLVADAVAVADGTAVCVTAGTVAESGTVVAVADGAIFVPFGCSVDTGVVCATGVSIDVPVGVAFMAAACAEKEFNGALNRIEAIKRIRNTRSVRDFIANIFPPDLL
jgi:hypothetical protein